MATQGAARWAAGFVLVLALHVGLAAYLVSAAREVLDGTPSDAAITVELTPDPSPKTAKPDEIAGPKTEDPDPPAPEQAAPTEAKREPDTAPAVTVPSSPDDRAELQQKKPEDRPPDPKKPPVEKPPDAKKDVVERQTAPSQASDGDPVSGGRRPSAAAKRTWAGEVGSHLGRNRRYPREARSKGWQGIARVKMTLDGNGHVLDRELVKGTGRPILDNEALALVERSDPFPKPPAGMPAPVTVTIPVDFAIH